MSRGRRITLDPPPAPPPGPAPKAPVRRAQAPAPPPPLLRPGIRRSFGSIVRRRRTDGTYHPGFYIQWSDASGHRHMRLGGATPEDAERELRRVQAQIENPELARQDLSFGAFVVSEYLPAAAMRMAPLSFEATERHLRNADRFFGNLSLRDIDVPAMERYFAHLKDSKELKASSLRRHRSSLFTCFEKAVRSGLAMKNPLREVKLPREDEVPVPYLSPDEILKLFTGMHPRIRSYVILLGETGLRPGEWAKLLWQNVEADFSRILVRKSKSGKVRYVHLTKLARETLIKLHGTRAPAPLRGPYYVFPEATTGAMRTWQRIMARRCRELGFPGLTFRSLRHVLASSLVRSNVPIPTVAKTLGHASPLMVLQRYGAHAPENEVELAMRKWEATRGWETVAGSPRGTSAARPGGRTRRARSSGTGPSLPA
jgi:integrase